MEQYSSGPGSIQIIMLRNLERLYCIEAILRL